MSKKIVEHYSILCMGIKIIVRAGEGREGPGGPGMAGMARKYQREHPTLRPEGLPSKDSLMLHVAFFLRGTPPSFLSQKKLAKIVTNFALLPSLGQWT